MKKLYKASIVVMVLVSIFYIVLTIYNKKEIEVLRLSENSTTETGVVDKDVLKVKDEISKEIRKRDSEVSKMSEDYLANYIKYYSGDNTKLQVLKNNSTEEFYVESIQSIKNDIKTSGDLNIMCTVSESYSKEGTPVSIMRVEEEGFSRVYHVYYNENMKVCDMRREDMATAG